MPGVVSIARGLDTSSDVNDSIKSDGYHDTCDCQFQCSNVGVGARACACACVCVPVCVCDGYVVYKTITHLFSSARNFTTAHIIGFWLVNKHLFICVCMWVLCGYSNIGTDPCPSDPCRNGGTLRRSTGGFVCACSTRFTGDICEIGKN